MTREEAIEKIENLDNCYNQLSDDDKEALDMAIKALEQEPCEDWRDVPSDEMTLGQARQAVKDLRKMWAELLEHKPCDDAISRHAALDYFVTNVGFHDENGYPIEDSDELRKIWTEYFDGIPSVASQPKMQEVTKEEEFDNLEGMLEDLWNATVEDHRKYSEDMESEGKNE